MKDARDDVSSGTLSLEFLRGGGASSSIIELSLPPRFAQRYAIGPLLGRGATGVVYRAHDLKLNRVVAVKILVGRGDEALARFEREGRLTARIAHPHVVEVFDVDVLERHPCLVCELMEGGSLAALLARDGALDARRAAHLVAPVLDGLEACHAAKILHRDLKLSNVLLTADGTPKLADLGLARFLQDEDSLTETGQIVGTPAYLAPELLALDPPTPLSDLYSTGVMLYELLAKVRPFHADSLGDLLVAIARTRAPDVRTLAPATPEPLAELIARCLEKDPAARPRSAAILKDELLASVSTAPARGAGRPTGKGRKPAAYGQPAPALVTAPTHPSGANDRGQGVRIAVAALAIGAVGLAGLAVTGRARDTRPSPAPTSPPAASTSPAARAPDPALDDVGRRVDALWGAAGAWARRSDETLAQLSELGGDPQQTAAVLAEVEREMDRDARARELAAAARALEDTAAHADPQAASMAKARAACALFSIAARRHRLAIVRPRVAQLETTLQAASVFVGIERVPHPPALVDLLRRALGAASAAVDAAAHDPARHASRLAAFYHDLRLTAHWIYITPAAAVGPAGEAALSRFERALEAHSAGGAGTPHGVALRIALFERDRLRGTHSIANLELAIQELARLRERHPDAAPQLASVDERLRDYLEQYGPKQKPPAPSPSPGVPK